MKKCTGCKLEKEESEFGRRKNPSGNYAPTARCKICINQENLANHHKNKEVRNQNRADYRIENYAKEQETWKKYSKENKVAIDAKNKAYYQANKEKLLLDNKAYYAENRADILAQKKSYYQLNKERIDAYKKEYFILNKDKVRAYRNRPDIKFFTTCRNRVRTLMGTGKNTPTYLGCSKKFLMEWFQFNIDLDCQYELTLNNHGSNWEIDHVLPCSLFNHENEDEVNACFNWSNLYPLVNPRNQEKNNKILQSHILRQQLRVKLFIMQNKKYKEMFTIDVESCLPQHAEKSHARKKCNGFWMVIITRHGKSAAKPLTLDFLVNDEEGSETRDLLVSQLEMLKV